MVPTQGGRGRGLRRLQQDDKPGTGTDSGIDTGAGGFETKINQVQAQVLSRYRRLQHDTGPKTRPDIRVLGLRLLLASLVFTCFATETRPSKWLTSGRVWEAV